MSSSRRFGHFTVQRWITSIQIKKLTLLEAFNACQIQGT